MPNSQRQNAAAVIAALLILLFLYTAISKLADHHKFESVLGRSPLLKNINILLSWLIPISEIIICTLLFIPGTRQTGLLLSFLLMLSFTGYIAYMLWSGTNLPCSCGGVFRKLGWKSHLIFNLIITATAFLGWRLEKQNNFSINKQAKLKT